MQRIDASPLRRIVVYVLFGAMAGAVAGVVLREGVALVRAMRVHTESVRVPVPVKLPDNHAALRYLRALEGGDLVTVIDRTAWMQERLSGMRAAGASAEELAAERARLEKRISEHLPGAGQIQAEGLEDQYLVPPGSSWTTNSVENLANDNARIWVKVVYPIEQFAPRDATNQAIRSLRVGVTVSAEGLVQKSNVRGNLEIDPASATYDWPASTGG